ncbi:MAG: TrbI/VirB10 family protein [Cetobacterium sp.]
MDENEKDLDKIDPPKPQEKIKKEAIVVLIVLLLSAIVYGFYTSLRKPAEKVKKESIKEQEQIAQNKENYGDLDVLLKYDGLNLEKIEQNEVQKINAPDVAISETVAVTKNEIKDRYIEQKEQYYERLIQDEIAARKSNIEFQNTEYTELDTNIDTDFESVAQNNTTGISGDDQKEKKAFLNSEPGKKNYNQYQELEAYSKYEIKTGSILPGVMITGINSDLPGTITGNIRENVYDSTTGNYLLIPQGTKVVGTYDSSIKFGQSRILIVWQRLLFPDGKSLNLDNFPGVDLSGYAGIGGKVNNHTLKLLQAVVLSSIIGAGGAIVTSDKYDEDDWRVAGAQGAGEQLISIGDTIANKILAIQPTIEVKPGSRFNLIVNSDIILTPYSSR